MMNNDFPGKQMNNVLLTLKTFTGNIHMMFWLEPAQKQLGRSSFCLHSAKYTKCVQTAKNVAIDCFEALIDFIVIITCLCS